MVLYPNHPVAVRTFLIDRQAIRAFKECDERRPRMFGQRLPLHDLVGFAFNLISRHGHIAELVDYADRRRSAYAGAGQPISASRSASQAAGQPISTLLESGWEKMSSFFLHKGVHWIACERRRSLPRRPGIGSPISAKTIRPPILGLRRRLAAGDSRKCKLGCVFPAVACGGFVARRGVSECVRDESTQPTWRQGIRCRRFVARYLPPSSSGTQRHAGGRCRHGGWV